MGERSRILLADDHAILRAGLKALLSAEPDMEVVGEAADGEEAVTKTRELRPELVVMDIAMPHLNGIEATRRIKEMGLGTRVLILTMHAEEHYLFHVLKAGGSGYVLKQSADRELIEAIRVVQRGDVFLYPSAARLLLQGFLDRVEDGEERERYDGLTERERDVLRLTAEGYSNREIAERLIISPKTVDTYRSRIMEKLDLHHRSELVKYAVRNKLLEIDDLQ